MAIVNKYNLVSLAVATAQGDGSSEYYFSMNDYSFFTLQIDDTAGVAGSNSYKVSGCASYTGTTYQEITSSLFGVSSVTGDNMFICDTPCHFKSVKLEVTRSADGGNTDGEWTISVKRSA